MSILIQEQNSQLEIKLINHAKKTILDPLEELDMDEKMAVLTDIVNSDPVQNQLNITEQKWEELHNLPIFGGGIKVEQVGTYSCKRFRVNVTAINVLQKKKKGDVISLNNYFQQHEGDTCKSSLKRIETDLWLSDQYPLRFDQFMQVLDALSVSGNASMRKMQEFLQNKCLQEVTAKNGFPVKV